MNLNKKQFRNCNAEPVPYDGSPVTWRISAYALVYQDQKILLVKNKLEKFYDVPGGRIDMDESIKEALTREAREEAGVEIKIGKIVAYFEDYFYHKNGTFHKTLLLFFSAKFISGNLKPTDPNMNFAKFVPIDQLNTHPTLDYVRQIIENNQPN